MIHAIFDIWVSELISLPLSTKQIWAATVKIAIDRVSRSRQEEEREMQLAMERWTSRRIRRRNEELLLSRQDAIDQTIEEMHLFCTQRTHRPGSSKKEDGQGDVKVIF